LRLLFGANFKTLLGHRGLEPEASSVPRVR
jgi:hypothetical protein